MIKISKVAKTLFVAVLGAFVVAGKVNAEEPVWRHRVGTREEQDLRSSWRPEPPKERKWEVAPEVFWFFYEEPGISVEWDGIMYGLNVSYAEEPRSRQWVSRLEGRFAGGGVDYDGSLSDGTPHTDEGIDWFFETRWLVGRNWESQKTLFRPLLGLGYRFWFDDLESRFAYQRRVQYLYSPVGLEVTHSFSDRWHIGFTAEYDFFWSGWVRSQLSDVNPNFNDPENRQDQGFGVRGSLFLRRLSNGKVSFSIEPFIRYWDIENSDTAAVTFAGTLIGGGYEPANNTVESGLRISYFF